MANLQSDTVHDWRSWRDLLWLLVFFTALTWRLPDAGAQGGPELTAPGPPPTNSATANPAANPAVNPAVNPAANPAAGPAGPSPGNSLAAASPADMVVDVKIAGNKSLPLQKILPSIHTRAGRPFDLQQIAEDVRRLDHTHQFVNVRTYWQKVPGGRIVFFEVIERPLLQEVWFVGCSEIGKKKLQKESDLKKGDPVDPIAIEEARRKIEELYRKRGFNSASVMLLEGDKPEDRRAIFLIDEGPKQRVWKTEFVGNKIASGDRLATQIGSKHPFLYLFGGEYDRKKVDEDKEKLTAYYRGLGFFRARIGCEPMFDEKENWVTIRFVIDEGPRYKIRNVSVIGNRKYTNEELLGELKLKSDNYFNQASMTADVQAIQDKYGSVGYVFADIRPDPRFLEEPGRLDLVYSVTEGDRYRVGKINIQIKGVYSHTQENTVRNRLFFKPGDIVDIRQIRASEVALKRSGLFESNPAEGNPPKVVFSPPDHEGQTPEDDKEQQVAEKPKTGRGLGIGFRGQSPDSESCDRELNLTVDCGRYVGPSDDPSPAAAPPSARIDEAMERGASADVVPANSAGAAQVGSAPASMGCDMPSPDLVQAAQAYSEALARARQQRPRVQYLAPDDSRENRGPLPQNLAPGDSAEPRYSGGGPTAGQSQEESLHDLARKVRERAQAVAAQKREQRSREGLIPTQYSANGGQVNPATIASPQWSVPAAATNGNDPRSTTAPMYVASRPDEAPSLPSNGAVGPQAVPSSPAASDPWPGNGSGRPVASPQDNYVPGPIFGDNSVFHDGPPDGGPPLRTLPIDVRTEEAMTGRLMFGVGVNSDAGLVGSVVLDEQNFDWTRFPNSWEDVSNATAWRGAGQRFRIEAVPGTSVQRYMVTFEEPYMFGTQVSNSLSGYYYNRIYNEYTDQRLGGRIAFGYQFSPALSGNIAYRGEKINISNPEDPKLPDLEAVVGRDLAMHSFELSVAHDTRDNAFLATEGHLAQASFEEVLGSFQYPRARVDLRKYFTLYQRPDGSGRHVFTLSGSAGWSGDNTPIYDRFYAGGFSSIRGFQFRGASPQEVGPSTGVNIVVGGDFQVLASAEYMFPITADDMVRGVVFCDSGTVEPSIKDWSNKYRVAPGFGLRICIPAMGPAPIALDFAFPISWQPGDHSEMFSFFVGFGR